MNHLDTTIKAALQSATDLPEGLKEPNLTEELLTTFNGRHSWLMKWGAVKMGAAIVLMLFCAWQFFQQETTLGLIAYASGVVMCATAYAAIFLFIWVQMNHNTTVREIKRL